MATPQDVKNQSELLDLATQYADQLKFIVKEQKEKYTLDSLSVSLANQLVKNVQSVNKAYEGTQDVLKEIYKNNTELNKVLLQQQTLEKSIGDEGKKRIEDLKSQEDKVKSLKEQYQQHKKLQEEGGKVSKSTLETLSKQISAEYQSLAAQQQILTSEEKQYMVISNIEQGYRKNLEILDEQMEIERQKEELVRQMETNLIKSTSLMVAGLQSVNGVLHKMGAGALASKLGFKKAAEQTAQMTKEMTNNGERTLTTMEKAKIAGAGLFTVIKSLLSPITLIAAGFFLVKSLFNKAKESAEKGEEYLKKMSEQSTGLARSLGISQSNAEKLAGSARAIGGSMGMTSEMATQSAGAIYGAMKGVEQLSGSTMKTFMQLNAYAGVSAETLDEMHKMAKLTGQDAGVMANNMADVAAQSIKSYGVNVSQKEVLSGVAKQSNELKLNFGGSAEGLTKAFVKAKSLGFELDKMKNIAQSLLNIEDSIAAEMEAELLTGKELNLEKAREAALNHDVNGLMDEIAKNYGSIEDFQKMNVLQQEAAAKAIGMSSEELANVLAGNKQNKSDNQAMLDLQKQGIQAMTSMASLAEQMQNMEEAKQAMRANEAKDFLELKKLFHEIDAILRPIYSEIFAGILGIAKDIVTEFKSFLGDTVDTQGTADKIRSTFAVIRDHVKVFARKFFELGRNILPSIITGIKFIGKLIMGAISSVNEFFKFFREGGRNVDGVKAAIGGIIVTIIAAYKAYQLYAKFQNSFLGKKLKAQADEKKKLKESEKATKAITDAIKEGNTALVSTLDSLKDMLKTQKKSNDTTKKGTDLTKRQQAALKRARDEKGRFIKDQKKSNDLIKTGTDLTKRQQAALKRARDEKGRFIKEQKTEEKLTKNQIKLLDKEKKALEKLKNIQKQINDEKKKGNDLTKKGNQTTKAGIKTTGKGLLGNIYNYAAKAAQSVASIPFVGAALAAAALVAATAGGNALYEKFMGSSEGDDVFSPGGNSNGYGTRTLLGPQGAIRLNNKDSVIAGTNLFDKGKGGGGNTGGSDPALVAEMQAIKSVLQQILVKEGAVMIDGNKVGSTLALASYKTQ